ncbi:MAG: hypothetical protein V1716_04100 [Candidatus Uhrbacteria bacterium]
MTKFEKYIEVLASHEDTKSESFLDSRGRILVNAGIRLNWIGDFISNPQIKYKLKSVPINKVLFTGTNPSWNKILIDQCEKSVEKFQALTKNNLEIKKRFLKEASFGDEPILMRGPDENGLYRVFDGMHRFVGAVLKNKKTISAYVPINEDSHLPICEAHVIYDLIRGFQRHAKDQQGKRELYYALKLLARTYENVVDLLNIRFSFKYVPDKDVQKIIEKVIKKIKK